MDDCEGVGGGSPPELELALPCAPWVIGAPSGDEEEVADTMSLALPLW